MTPQGCTENRAYRSVPQNKHETQQSARATVKNFQHLLEDFPSTSQLLIHSSPLASRLYRAHLGREPPWLDEKAPLTANISLDNLSLERR